MIREILGVAAALALASAAHAQAKLETVQVETRLVPSPAKYSSTEESKQ